VTAWDDKEEARTTAPADAAIEDFVAGDLSRFDSIVVTPGLPLNRHPIAARAKEAGVEIIGDIELFSRARPELPPHKVVGITGTNGKSTTTALVHHILQTAGVPSLMGGNIGLPILSQDPLPEGGVYVLELSSYQIDLTKSLDCDVAVLLNITPDHLDRYDGFEAYAASKARLFEMQAKAGRAVVLGDDKSSLHVASLVHNRLVPTAMGSWIGSGVCLAEDTQIRLFSKNRTTPNTLFFDGGDTYGAQSEWPALQGPHNAKNVVAAMAAAYALSTDHGVVLSDEAIGRAAGTYPGLPHRMERVREKDGVLFINDSKATNPTAAAPALAAFPAVRWILGGQAKSDQLDECATHFGNVRAAYTIGEAADLFERLLKPHMPVKNCGELGAAVKQAAADAEEGDTVLLSPACASFDQFKDFEARGEAFRVAVEAL
jgi:UDP-N-acetylmuramoylalanine--D-glutamate ligase